MLAAAPRPGPRLRHVPALDGLRGLAILGVLAFHAGYLPGGFLGVDLFFVLSGYLITSLLLVERAETGRIDVVAFWGRRARRLLPALLVMLAVVAGMVWLTGDPTTLAGVRGDALATLGYVANWREIVAGQSYWDLFAQPSPLDHTWSLAIEEQFYVVWPLVVAGLFVVWRPSRRALFVVITGLALASFAAMAIIHRPLQDPSRVYFGTDTRAAAILIGAATAALITRTPGSRKGSAPLDAAAVVAMAVLGVGWIVAKGASGWLYDGGLLALQLAAAVVIWTVVRRERGPAGTVLAWRPLRALGVISYGLYLWHWPVFVALSPERTGLSGGALNAVRLVTTLAVSVACYVLIERPIRRGAISGLRLAVLAPTAVAAVALVIVVGTVGDVPTAPPTASAQPDAAPRAANRSSSAVAPLRVLLAGDSTALVAAVALEANPRPDLLLSSSTRLGCGITRGTPISGGIAVDSNCGRAGQDYGEALASDRPQVVVLMSGAWEVLDHVIDGRVVRFDTPEGRAALDEAVASYVDPAVAAGARIVLLTAPCFAAQDDPLIPTDERNDPGRIAMYNDAVHAMAAVRGDDVVVLDYAPLVCRDGRPTGALRDGVHLSDQGAAEFWSWLAPRLRLLVPVVPAPAQ